MIAAALGIAPCNDVAAFTEMAKNAKVGEYVAKKIEVKTPEEEKEGANNQAAQVAAATPDDEKEIEQLI